MESAAEFKWLRPPFMLTPYLEQEGIFSPDNLVPIYRRLKDEGLCDVVFHDNPDMNLRGFLDFFGSRDVRMQIINTTDAGQFVDMAAIAWLANMEQYGDRIKAVGAFCVFKDYQTPVLTSPMAKMLFEYWFEQLKVDIVIGLTPALNRLSVRFIKRIGFQELCRIPGYSRYKGEYTDCVETILTKDRYRSLYGG